MELYDLRPFEGWHLIRFNYVVPLNGRPWVSNAALFTVDHTHLDGFRPWAMLIEREYEYNALNDIYSHLINNKNIDAVISNLRDAL